MITDGAGGLGREEKFSKARGKTGSVESKFN